MDLLREQYEHVKVNVEYRCQQWTHPYYHTYWKCKAFVNMWDAQLHYEVVHSIHPALAARSTCENCIEDVARQTVLAYQGKFYEETKNGDLVLPPSRPERAQMLIQRP